jgi:multiple antibiotic resistance protein
MHLQLQLIQHLAAFVSPATAAEEAFNSSYVKFSLLALSSIFFLVDPFAAIPSFIASSASSSPHLRSPEASSSCSSAST